MSLQIGLLLFPKVQQLDLTGPHEVFAAIPGATVHLVARDRAPVAASSGMVLAPDTDFLHCPPLDILCVPGGAGVNALLEDQAVLDFLRRQAAGARFVTSVCTGALVLGAAGLLRGRRATTHWNAQDLLPLYGATPVTARVVRDGNLMTGGGVTAGIDFALALAAELAGREVAEAIQLSLEYAPAPPFDAGRPETAPDRVLERVRARTGAIRAERQRLAEAYAARAE